MVGLPRISGMRALPCGRCHAGAAPASVAGGTRPAPLPNGRCPTPLPGGPRARACPTIMTNAERRRKVTSLDRKDQTGGAGLARHGDQDDGIRRRVRGNFQVDLVEARGVPGSRRRT